MPSSTRRGTPLIELSVDQQALRDVARLLKDEADGKDLRRELTKGLRLAVDKPVKEAQSNILAAPSKGHAGVPLRQSVARSVKPQVSLAGNQVGVKVRQRKTPDVRGFDTAGRQFNKGVFRHPVFDHPPAPQTAQARRRTRRRRELGSYGADKRWTRQTTGSTGWFDKPMLAHREPVKDAVLKIVQDLADTIAARIKARQ